MSPRLVMEWPMRPIPPVAWFIFLLAAMPWASMSFNPRQPPAALQRKMR